MSVYLFKARDGQTPLPRELQRDLKIKNIQTIGELDEYEEQNIAEGIAWIEESERECFDYEFWCELHKRLLKDVWSWAGKIRTHELGNPDFIRPTNIRTELMKLTNDAKYWFENDIYPKEECVSRLHERLLTIHPFANGNGRWSRILTEFICTNYEIKVPTWNIAAIDNPSLRRSEYIAAIEEARQNRDYAPLIHVIFN